MSDLSLSNSLIYNGVYGRSFTKQLFPLDSIVTELLKTKGFLYNYYLVDLHLLLPFPFLFSLVFVMLTTAFVLLLLIIFHIALWGRTDT